MFWTLTYMKLFQINSTLNWGSTGRIAEEIGQTAISKGWESYIAYGRYSNGSVSHTIQIGSRWNVYNHFCELDCLIIMDWLLREQQKT